MRARSAAALLLAVAGCATAPAATPLPTPTAPATIPVQTPPALNPAYRGVPGFDTRAYPGDAVMQAWLMASPYRWVGYYLPAPCHTDATWVGRRAALERMGWGTAVIFTGEQDWGAAATVSGPAASAAASAVVPQSPRCTRANLTAEHGTADALAADSAATADGFPAGSTIYLDVERVDSVSTLLATYVRAWMAGLLGAGRFRPGLYAHRRNADSLRAILESELARRGPAGAGRVWVAGSAPAVSPSPGPSASPASAAAPGSPASAAAAGSPGAAPSSPGPGGFDVAAAPTESGLAYATIWQGAHDARQSWAGSTLRIDVNVASLRSPSAPPTP